MRDEEKKKKKGQAKAKAGTPRSGFSDRKMLLRGAQGVSPICGKGKQTVPPRLVAQSGVIDTPVQRPGHVRQPPVEPPRHQRVGGAGLRRHAQQRGQAVGHEHGRGVVELREQHRQGVAAQQLDPVPGREPRQGGQRRRAELPHSRAGIAVHVVQHLCAARVGSGRRDRLSVAS